MPNVVVENDGYVQTWDHRDTPAEITIERDRKQVYRGPGISREHRIIELHDSLGRSRDRSPRPSRRSSRSANTPRREMELAHKDRRRHDSSDSESDSDCDTEGSSPRRIRSRKHYNKDLPVAPAGPVYAKPPDRPRSVGAPRSRSQGPPGPPRHYDSDSDSSSSSDDHGGRKAQPKPPPKQILYTGLACVATLAAANNIYQSAKAHHARQRELEEGEISSAEAQKLKMQARKMDLISLGVAAVGAYNVRNGWKRAELHWKAHKEMQAEGRR